MLSLTLNVAKIAFDSQIGIVGGNGWLEVLVHYNKT
jgi:hypothetical protein